MLTEEALLLLVTLGACVLVILGTLELVAPSRPRRLVAARPRLPVPLAPVASPPATSPPSPAIVRCAEALRALRYPEVVSEATAALHPAGLDAASASAEEAAALWSMLGRACHAMGDAEGARAGLESALALAPRQTRAEHAAHLVSLVLAIARAHVDRAASTLLEPEGRVADLCDALAWLDRGLAVRGDDRALLDLRATAHAALDPAYEAAAHSLIRRQQYTRARQMLGQALAEGDVPVGRQHLLRDLLSASFNGEIGQVSAQVMRSLHELREAEALASLRRAEELLEAMPADALPTARREEVDRRLLWGYTRLGEVRVQGGEIEAAREPPHDDLMPALSRPRRLLESLD